MRKIKRISKLDPSLAVPRIPKAFADDLGVKEGTSEDMFRDNDDEIEAIDPDNLPPHLLDEQTSDWDDQPSDDEVW